MPTIASGTITPCFWFDGQAAAAARHYVSIFTDAAIGATTYYGANMPQPAGEVLTVEFALRGLPFMALNAGPGVGFTDALSLQVDCATQAEIDHHWSGLLADGGREMQCGWLKDRFGVAWQVFPSAMNDMRRTGSPEAVQRMMQAMMGMVKLDMAALEAAFAGV